MEIKIFGVCERDDFNGVYNDMYIFCVLVYLTNLHGA